MSRRIVFLIPSLDIGGAQRQLVELADGMHRADWQVKVLTFYGGGELEADLRERGVPLVVLNKRGRWDLVAFSYHAVLVNSLPAFWNHPGGTSIAALRGDHESPSELGSVAARKSEKARRGKVFTSGSVEFS